MSLAATTRRIPENVSISINLSVQVLAADYQRQLTDMTGETFMHGRAQAQTTNTTAQIQARIAVAQGKIKEESVLTHVLAAD